MLCNHFIPQLLATKLNHMNILITSAGRRVSLVRAFQTEARMFDSKSRVLAVDVQPELSPACQLSDYYQCVPEASSTGYIPVLLNICISKNIDLLIPTIDPELEILAENRSLFEELGTKMVVSDIELIRACQDKRNTINFFEQMGISTPQILDKQQPEYPIYAKPYDGSSSENNYIIKRAAQLRDHHMNDEKLLFFEYLDHKVHDEYTLDLYYDRQSELKCVVPRKRLEVRDGEISKGLTEDNMLVPFVRDRMSNIPGARGCLTLQLFVNKQNKNIHGIELNPRFGGGYPLSYLAGANYPRWLIEEYLMNRRIDYFYNWEPNLLMLRYDNEVLVHDYHD